LKHFSTALIIQGRQRDPRFEKNPQDPSYGRLQSSLASKMKDVEIATCEFCHAQIFKGESKMICCRGGKVVLPFLQLPVEAAHLFKGKTRQSKLFLQNIRTLNSAFSMASMGVKLDKTLANERVGAYTFRVSGVVHHLIGKLLPETGNESNFAQIYFLGPEEQLARRLQLAPNNRADVELMTLLKDILNQYNPLVQSFEYLRDVPQFQEAENQLVKFRLPKSKSGRVYNKPTVSEIAVLIPDGDQGDNRDVIISKKATGVPNVSNFQSINELSPLMTPLTYALAFWHGEPGWELELKLRTPRRIDDPQDDYHRDSDLASDQDEEVVEAEDINDEDRDGKSVTCKMFWAYRFMIRKGIDPITNLPYESDHLLRSEHLFHQILVDAYASIEAGRLTWMRLNQKTIRAEVYNSARDSF
jgi:hypothetical protein